ncbi:MAG: nucleoside/nucleotide kinase family protein [Atopobiaceae bacterium]|nr:nucleoside/nucleotide kinase family protein [Atopobiaceae bacterium]
MAYELDLCVNGLAYPVSLTDETVNEVLLVLLKRIAALEKPAGKARRLVFLGGPPAAGKSTLALLLEHFAHTSGLCDVQVAGLDGFHHTNEYLATHCFVRDGNMLSLKDYKGVPESFDVDSFSERLGRLIHDTQVSWPVYDRQIHDPVPDACELSAPIVLLEGNWLLLDEEPWKSLVNRADLTLLIRADTELLKERSIWRKMQGGSTRASARAHFERVDAPNIERVLAYSIKPDVSIEYHPEADFSFVT